MNASSRRSFLLNEIQTLAWNGSVQRANLYRKGTQETKRGAFRAELLAFVLRELIPKYENSCSAEDHLKNLAMLMTEGTKLGKDLLTGDDYKSGVAQKLLNLLLKYLWCLGEIPEPPHCPIDRFVLEEVKYKGDKRWTLMVEIEEYEDAMAAIKAAAGDKSIAEWELGVWNNAVGVKQ